jgi:hypothetical protein
VQKNCRNYHSGNDPRLPAPSANAATGLWLPCAAVLLPVEMEDAEPIPSRTISRSLGDVKGAPPPHAVPSNAQNDIPWLLIKVHAAGDTAGTFSKVVYIQCRFSRCEIDSHSTLSASPFFNECGRFL